MFLGIDVGTQSLKALLVDEEFRPRGSGTARYETVYPRPGWAEQDPRDWLQALGPAIHEALAEAAARPSDVAALAICGQLDGCIATDASGRSLANAIIWMDRRAGESIDGVDRPLLRRRTGLVPDATHMAAKIAWLKHNRKAETAAVAVWHQPVSWMVAALTGRSVMDPSLASTTMLADLTTRQWDPALCAVFDVDPRSLPEIADAASIAGYLSGPGAALTGLPAGTPVAVGTGDDFSNTIGCGICEPGVIGVTLGTSEVVAALSREPVLDEQMLLETRSCPTGHYQLGNPGWLSGGALRWFTRAFGAGGDADLDRLAATVPAGSDGLLFFPGLSGAMSPRWNASARGIYYGIAASHGQQHFIRAILEGTAFAMRDVVDRMRAIDLHADSIRLSGGGASSPLWAQMRADVSGLPVEAFPEADASASGAAVLAAVAVGFHGSIAEASKHLPLNCRRYEPRSELKQCYDDAYRRYRLLFDQLEPAFGRLLPEDPLAAMR